jgi:hypothetical protein
MAVISDMPNTAVLVEQVAIQTTVASTSTLTTSPLQKGILLWWLQENVGVPPANAAAAAAAAPPGPPTNQEVSILQEAFAAFYGNERNVEAAEQLLTQSIEAWQRQAPDEQAGLYRVRGDCYMVSAAYAYAYMHGLPSFCSTLLILFYSYTIRTIYCTTVYTYYRLYCVLLMPFKTIPRPSS